MLWLRAEGSRAIGLGHVMRMVALAQTARRRGITASLVLAGDSRLPGLVAREGVETMALGDTGHEWIHSVRAGDVVVLDGPHFPPTLHRTIRGFGARVVVFDDLGRGRFEVDLLVNQSRASGVTYDVPSTTNVLLGPRYACIRSDFREPARLRTRTEHLLVVMGGSDATDLTWRIIDELTLRDHPFRSVTALLGPIAQSDRHAPKGVHVLRAPDRVADVFRKADAAISAAGSTTWELLSMGVPCALVPVAPNQRGVIETVATERAALITEHPDDLVERLGTIAARLAAPGVRTRLSARGRAIVDGKGSDRVLAAALPQSGP